MCFVCGSVFVPRERDVTFYLPTVTSRLVSRDRTADVGDSLSLCGLGDDRPSFSLDEIVRGFAVFLFATFAALSVETGPCRSKERLSALRS